MRVFKLLLVACVFVLVAAGVYLWRLPARVAWQYLQVRVPALHLNGIEGTLWDGHADGISLVGRDLGRLHWQLPKWPLLAGKPTVDLRIEGGEVELAGQVERLGASRFELQDLRFSVPAARFEPLFAAGDVQLQGTLAGTLGHASLAGIDLRQVAGTARWSDVGVRTPRGELHLGALAGDFASQADGSIVGSFKDDASGTLAVDGTFRLRLPAYEAEAILRARNADAQTQELLGGIGEPQPDGSRLVRVQGVLPAGH